MLFCHITSHCDDEKYPDLLEEKGGQGFPHLAVLDADGNVIAVHEENRTIDQFLVTIDKGVAFMDTKKKADGGDKAAQFEVVVTLLEAGALKFDEAKEKIGKLGKLTPEQEEKLKGPLAGAEIAKLVDDQQKEKVKKFLEMRKAGKIPSAQGMGQEFWGTLISHALKEKDPELLSDGIEGMRKFFGDNPNAAGWFSSMESQLEKMKAAKGSK